MSFVFREAEELLAPKENKAKLACQEVLDQEGSLVLRVQKETLVPQDFLAIQENKALRVSRGSLDVLEMTERREIQDQLVTRA